MSHHNKTVDKAYDAKRLKKQSTKGNMWKDRPPGYDAERMRKMRQENGREPRFMIIDSFKPLNIESDAIVVCPDWHIPFQDSDFVQKMLNVCEERGIKEIAIPGDLWDCDNYSRFVHLGWRDCFRAEIDNVRAVMLELNEHFDHIYCCRGNHEKRWIDGNLGMMGMRELFALLELEPNSYTITLDDSMTLCSGGRSWLLAHPRNFRQTQLSVARDLAAKYRMNICSAHGHQFAQGVDRSGHYDLLDAGGMFDPHALEYLRQTNCFPAVQGGFYLIIDGKAEPHKNDSPGHKIGAQREIMSYNSKKGDK